jgi:hypothetical protein
MGMCKNYYDNYFSNNTFQIVDEENNIWQEKLQKLFINFKKANLILDIKKCYIMTTLDENYLVYDHSFNSKIHNAAYYEKIKEIEIKFKFLSTQIQISLFPIIRLGEEYFPIEVYLHNYKTTISHVKGEVTIIIISENPTHFKIDINGVRINMYSVILSYPSSSSSNTKVVYKIESDSRELAFYNKIYNINKCYPHFLIINKNAEVIFNSHFISMDNNIIQNCIQNNVEFYSEDSTCLSMLPKKMRNKTEIKNIYSIHNDDNGELRLETYFAK